MTPIEHMPGEPAAFAGRYEQLNVLGGPTGVVVAAVAGETLPSAPRGFTWRRLADSTPEELRTKAAEYRHLADTAATRVVMDGLREIADRFEALADQKARETP